MVLFLMTMLIILPVMAFAVDVSDFGAKGDGATDDTAAFQKALDSCKANGGIVNAGVGQYRINGTLEIPEGVTLKGIWEGPHASNLSKGTTLLAYSGRGKEDSAPFITLNTSSTLKGVTIFYPEQKPKDIVPYPWTVQGKGQHYNVIDTTIANSYNGIECGTFHNEGHHLRNVHICALRRGVFIDQCTDIGRLENVHIHSVYWWRVGGQYAPSSEEINLMNEYTRANLEGFIIGRADWEYISNSFVIWAKVGFRFIRTSSKAGGVGNAVITQSGSDIGPLAVLVEETQAHAGVAFENCQFMSNIEIRPTNTGPIKFSNCGFWGVDGAGIPIQHSGDNTVTLTNCHFSEWAVGKPAIIQTGGSLMLQSSDFRPAPAGSSHIQIGKGAKSALITGNRFQGGSLNLQDNSEGAQVKTGENLSQ